MNENLDAFDEVFEVEEENYFRTSNVYIDNFILYLTSDEYKVLSYMIRNIAGRSNFKHHSLAISVIAKGRQLDKTYCVGLGIKEATVRKCLQSLVEFGFIVPIGKPTSIGQNWKIGKQIKMGELRKRYQEKLDRDIARIQAARSNIGKGKEDPFCDTVPLLSDRTPPLLSDRTSDVLSHRTHRKKEEKQKKETTTLQAATASRGEAGSVSHNGASAAPSVDWPGNEDLVSSSQESEISAQAEKVITPAVTPSPWLEAKADAKSTETTALSSPIAPAPFSQDEPATTPPPPAPSPAVKTVKRSEKQLARDESLKIAMNALAAAMGMTLTTTDEARCSQIAQTLVKATIPYSEFELYVKRLKLNAKQEGNWTVTMESLIKNMRPSEYVTARDAHRKKQEEGQASGQWKGDTESTPTAQYHRPAEMIVSGPVDPGMMDILNRKDVS